MSCAGAVRELKNPNQNFCSVKLRKNTSIIGPFAIIAETEFLFESSQVANEGYEAFNKAHTNMDKIRLQTIEAPNHLRNVLNILFKVCFFKLLIMPAFFIQR